MLRRQAVIIAPIIDQTVISGSVEIFKFDFGGQSFPRPFSISFRVIPGNLDDGIIIFSLDIAAGAFRLFPIGILYKFPPPLRIEWIENQRTRRVFFPLISKVRSAVVTYPVSSINLRNWALVTSVSSTQSSFTVS